MHSTQTPTARPFQLWCDPTAKSWWSAFSTPSGARPANSSPGSTPLRVWLTSFDAGANGEYIEGRGPGRRPGGFRWVYLPHRLSDTQPLRAGRWRHRLGRFLESEPERGGLCDCSAGRRQDFGGRTVHRVCRMGATRYSQSVARLQVIQPTPTPTPAAGTCEWTEATRFPTKVSGEALTSLNGYIYKASAYGQ